ncbi:hypothetical protein ACFQT0_20260 [Hymenobacter humi]|uniref:Bacterial Pleckstrin homology domain-containing protein n=1 Tax=Hymenobacter humi TaxID=1411620 RepID=A0ABW2UAQ2_9BACT
MSHANVIASEVRFNTVGEEPRSHKIAFYAFLTGIFIFGVGFTLSKFAYSLGTDLQPIGVLLGFAACLWFAIRIATGKSGRRINDQEVLIQPDTIALPHRNIDLHTVKVIDATLEYKGGITHGGSLRSMANGTGNCIRLVYKDASEESIRFYIPHASQLEILRKILQEARQRHAFLLIM